MRSLIFTVLAAGGVSADDARGEIPPWLLEDEEVAQGETPVSESMPVVVVPVEVEGIELSVPPEELFAEVAAHISKRMAELFPTVTGGPGLSQDTAWVLGPDVYPFPDKLCAVLPEGYAEMDAANVMGGDDREYFVVDFVLEQDGKAYDFSFWVDVQDAALTIPEEEINREEESEEGAVDIS